MSMRLLSFDSSGEGLTVALAEGGNLVLDEREFPDRGDRQEAISRLMPFISECLEKVSWRRTDLELIVVGVGPGSFTGIRTSVVTARTLAQALGIPLIGIDSLISRSYDTDLPSTLVMAAGRGQCFLGAYDSDSSGAQSGGDLKVPVETMAPICLKLEELPGRIGHQAHPLYVDAQLVETVESLVSEESLSNFASGELGDETARKSAAALAHELADQHVEALEIKSLPSPENMAANQARIAWASLERRAAAMNKDVAKLVSGYGFEEVLPLYLRGPSITLKKTDGSKAIANLDKKASAQ